MIWYLLGRFYASRKNFEMAAKYLLRAQNCFRSAEDYVLLAESLHNIDQSEEAMKRLNIALDKFPSNSYLYERRSHFLREMNREEEALADLHEAIKLNPDSYINWYTRGIVNLDLELYEDAIRDLQEAIKREDPKTVVSTYYELAMVYYQNGNIEESVHYLMKTIRKHASVPIYYYRLAVILHHIDRTEEAIQYLLEGMKLLDVYEAKPDKGFSLFAQASSYSYGAFKTFQTMIEPTYSFRKDLSEMYASLGQYDLAIDAVTNAMKKYPDCAELHLIRANLYQECERRREAEEDIRIAIDLQPTDTEGYLELAKLYRIQGEERNELEILLKLLENSPESPLGYYQIADVYIRLNQLEKALHYNNQLLSIEDDDHLNYTQRGEILLHMRRYTDSVDAFDQALELSDDAGSRYRKSYILFLNGDYEKSLEELFVVAQLDPSWLESPDYYVGTGHNYKAIQNVELAIHEFTTAIQLEPDQSEYRKYRAECYLEAGQYDLAIEDCTAAIQQHPDHAVYYSIRSYALYRIGQYEQAREDVRLWLELEPNSPDVYYCSALIDYELMNVEAAHKMLQQCIAIDPTFHQAYLLLAHIHYHWLDYDECEDCIVRWATHLYATDGKDIMIQSIYLLEGIDQDVLERAVIKLQSVYGESVYIS